MDYGKIQGRWSELLMICFYGNLLFCPLGEIFHEVKREPPSTIQCSQLLDFLCLIQ